MSCFKKKPLLHDHLVVAPATAFLQSNNVTCALSLHNIFAARHYVVEIACGCTAHTVLAFPVAPRGGGLSRAHSLGRPPCTPWHCVTTQDSLFRMYVIFLDFAVGCLPLFLPLSGTSFCVFAQERLGWCYKTITSV